jgi:hypothetical protein
LRTDQKQALTILARHVVSQLELRRRSRDLTSIRAEVDKTRQENEKLRAELAETRRRLNGNANHHSASSLKPAKAVRRSRR